MCMRSTCRAVSCHRRKDQTMIGDRFTQQRLSICCWNSKGRASTTFLLSIEGGANVAR
jgi:hypothetical protein